MTVKDIYKIISINHYTYFTGSVIMNIVAFNDTLQNKFLENIINLAKDELDIKKMALEQELVMECTDISWKLDLKDGEDEEVINSKKELCKEFLQYEITQYSDIHKLFKFDNQKYYKIVEIACSYDSSGNILLLDYLIDLCVNLMNNVIN